MESHMLQYPEDWKVCADDDDDDENSMGDVFFLKSMKEWGLKKKGVPL